MQPHCQPEPAAPFSELAPSDFIGNGNTTALLRTRVPGYPRSPGKVFELEMYPPYQILVLVGRLSPKCGPVAEMWTRAQH
eukprot:1681086-Rhodomonas_salina.1